MQIRDINYKILVDQGRTSPITARNDLKCKYGYRQKYKLAVLKYIMQKQMQEATQNTTQNMGGVFSLLK
jgi:hypothetical protein